MKLFPDEAEAFALGCKIGRDPETDRLEAAFELGLSIGKYFAFRQGIDHRGCYWKDDFVDDLDFLGEHTTRPLGRSSMYMDYMEKKKKFMEEAKLFRIWLDTNKQLQDNPDMSADEISDNIDREVDAAALLDIPLGNDNPGDT